jgi:uridylate kinase
VRVLLKISGESLSGIGAKGFHREAMELVAHQIWEATNDGHEIGVLVGGGNIVRGSELSQELDLDRQEEVVADWIGMLATMQNGAALKVMLERLDVETRLMLADAFPNVGELWVRERALHHLGGGRVIVLAGGTGNPCSSTDTAAVLRAVEIGADLVLKGTKVDGIYDRDPVQFPDQAQLIGHLTHCEFLDHLVRHQPLKVIDTTAVTMAGDKGMPIRVFNIFRQGSFLEVLNGRGVYSEISS